MLQHLRGVRENPPSLEVSLASEIVDPGNDESGNNDLDAEASLNLDNIDWDISVDTAQIDWDIGTIEETEDTANGLGPYEMVNASDLPNEATMSNKDEDNQLHEILVSDISWDVSVETPQVDVLDDVSFPVVGLENQTHVLENLTLNPGTKAEKSQLLETEYRNNILDDLYEVRVSPGRKVKFSFSTNNFQFDLCGYILV